MAKCPQCGKKISEGSHCEACEMEIHYKDFKGSELLDIRIPSSSSHPEEVVHKSVMAKINNSRSLDTPPAEKPLINKIVFFSLAGIAIILAVVSWYYLLKYFLKF